MEENLDIVREMVTISGQCLNDFSLATTGIRALCQYFGGQQIYLPKFKMEGSNIGEQVRGVICDAIGDSDGDKMVAELMRCFGGVQIYIPLEVRAFRREVAAEIKSRTDGTMETVRDLCRQYNMSFTQVYRLSKEAEIEKRQAWFDFNNG